MQQIEVKLAAEGVDAVLGEFSGYGAVFGNVDSYGDVIQAGAFAKSLTEWGKEGRLPPMLLQHGGWGMNADDLLPIGQWLEMSENARGLKVRGKLFAIGTERGQYILEGLKTGALDGLSIGYRARKFRMGTKPEEPARTLEEVELAEVSIVTQPANRRARISAVKLNDAAFCRKMERDLRAIGLSQAQAVKALGLFKKSLRDDGDEMPRDGEDEAVMAAAARLIARMRG